MSQIGRRESGTALASLRSRSMAKPLRSQLNQIRAWVRQGRTDAWIAHQLEVSTSELREFRRRHELDAEEETGEVDLRDEIEAEIEAATREEELAAEAAADEDDDAEDADDDEDGGDDRTAAVATPTTRTATASDRADAGAAAAAAAAGARAPRHAGDLRPRRGGLRALARPGGRRRPGLRRALGRTTARSRSRSSPTGS